VSVPFDPHIAAIRFGTGLSPRVAPPESAGAMLAALVGPDLMARAYPIAGFATAVPTVAQYHALNIARRDAEGAVQMEESEAAFRAIRVAARDTRLQFFLAGMARGVETADGFRERLHAFWADHFTVRARNAFFTHMVAPFAADTIRPHLTGRFADMLKAAVLHPMMLVYLDQQLSIGPNSPAGQRRNRGLNENLARELLELHTLGVDGPYDQGDVRELAELLTGLVWDARQGFRYVARNAEPGAETVLGVEYPGRADLTTIEAALEGLAAHPATARHIAGKLAVHFVSDTPDPALAAALEARFVETGGDLLSVYEVLLTHPAAWLPERAKVKQPYAYVQSALRALDVTGAAIMAMDRRAYNRIFGGPLTMMGQVWEEPAGPDGWPEEAEAWVTPQAVAGRVNWAMTAPQRLVRVLPDPRALVRVALGPDVPEAVVFAAGAAESVDVGVGVVFASAAFNRR